MRPTKYIDKIKNTFIRIVGGGGRLRIAGRREREHCNQVFNL